MNNLTPATRELIYEKIKTLKDQLEIYDKVRANHADRFDEFHEIDSDIIRGNIITLKNALFEDNYDCKY